MRTTVPARRPRGSTSSDPCPPGGCHPNNRCPRHSGDPKPVGDLLAAVLAEINHAGRRRRLRLIPGGRR